MTRANPQPMTNLNARVPVELIERMDKYVQAHSPEIHDRTHLVRIAISEYLSKNEAKQ